MAGSSGKCLLLTGWKLSYNQSLNLSVSCISMIKWRYEKGIEPNPNRFGVLTNLPDFSYIDGRPVPLSRGVQQRLKIQELYCERIVKLCNELDFAVERYKNMNKESKERDQKLIESKLIAKGRETGFKKSK